MKNKNPLPGVRTRLSPLRSYSGIIGKTLLAALLPILFIASCKKDTFKGETTDECPTVLTTDVANGVTNVPINKMVTVFFSEPIDASTITATTFTLSDGTNMVSGGFTFTDSTVMFTPAGNLTVNTTYTGTITTGVKDMTGNALVSNYTWSFTTGGSGDITPPTIVLTDPLDAATGVALDKIISATFSEPMDLTSVTNLTFTLSDGSNTIGGLVQYSNLIATFDPGAPLLANTTYTATITVGAKDTAGNAMVSDSSWTFVTAALDVTPPTVILTIPNNLETNVSVTITTITAKFSEPMDPLSVIPSFTISEGANPVAGSVTYTDSTATFTLSGPLAAGTTYTGTITTVAEDVAGNPLAVNKVWTFKTSYLGTISTYGSFGGSAGITNQGLNTVINGDIGTTGAPTLITGFRNAANTYTVTGSNNGLVTGEINTDLPAPGTAESMAKAQAGLLDATAAYNSFSPASKPGGTDPGAGELGGLTLFPGVYMAAGGSFQITGSDLTLDGQGNSNAEWVFQAASSLTVGEPVGPRSIILINGASAKNIFWYVGSAATINGAGGGIMQGTIISSAGVTFSTAGNAAQTVLNGRAISLNASVTMVNTTINVPQ